MSGTTKTMNGLTYNISTRQGECGANPKIIKLYTSRSS